MKAPDFAYVRPASIEDALAALAEAGDGGRLLAGGQSLMPMLNFRLATPSVLIDLNRIAGLDAIEDAGDVIRIGALARHAALERSDIIAAHVPLIANAMAHIAHPAIRSRGTIGGSLALADPAAELPACMVALDAAVIARSPAGERRIAAADFFRGTYETALGEAEVLTAVEVPRQQGRRQALDEIARRHGDFALAGVAVTAPAAGTLDDARIVLFAIADRPVRAHAAEAAIAGLAAGPGAADAAAAALGDIATQGDVHASAALRLHLARVLTRRAIAALAGAGT